MSLVKKKLLEMMPQLRRYSYGLTGSIDKGDDLLQDSIVKILSMNKDINHIDNLNAYFYKIISNDWKDKIKKRKVETYDIEDFSNTLSASDFDLNEKIDSKRKNKKKIIKKHRNFKNKRSIVKRKPKVKKKRKNLKKLNNKKTIFSNQKIKKYKKIIKKEIFQLLQFGLKGGVIWIVLAKKG